MWPSAAVYTNAPWQPGNVFFQAIVVNQGQIHLFKKEEVKTMYEDKTLVCKECGKEFTFTAGEQEFYAERGFVNEPQRCKDCRDARKNKIKTQKEMYTTTCAACGCEAKVPFKPREDRPVYCSECFAKMKNEE